MVVGRLTFRRLLFSPLVVPVLSAAVWFLIRMVLWVLLGRVTSFMIRLLPAGERIVAREFHKAAVDGLGLNGGDASPKSAVEMLRVFKKAFRLLKLQFAIIFSGSFAKSDRVAIGSIFLAGSFAYLVNAAVVFATTPSLYVDLAAVDLVGVAGVALLGITMTLGIGLAMFGPRARRVASAAGLGAVAGELMYLVGLCPRLPLTLRWGVAGLAASAFALSLALTVCKGSFRASVVTVIVSFEVTSLVAVFGFSVYRLGPGQLFSGSAFAYVILVTVLLKAARRARQAIIAPAAPAATSTG